MAPTSEERREVAARLRREAEGYRKNQRMFGHTSRFDTGEIPGVFQDVCAFVGLKGYIRCAELFDRLADLIDPEEEDTCCDVSDDWDFFTCSRCVCAVRLRSAEADAFENVTYGPTLTMPNGRGKKLSFCPYCGARVIQEDK